MSDITNYSGVVVEAAQLFGFPNRKSEQETAVLTAIIASRIYWGIGDKDFGLLRKNPGQNQHEVLHTGIDVLLHRPTGIAIDIFTNSGSATSQPSWQVKDGPEEPRYLTPGDFVVPPKLPVPNEPQHEDVHTDTPPPVDEIDQLITRIATSISAAVKEQVATEVNRVRDELLVEIRRGRCVLRRY